MQEILGLPASAIESDGRGTSHSLASNETAQGRALNRRIEVEFWYDDPLRELSDEPQLCPDDVDENGDQGLRSPWGTIPTIELANGQPIIPPDLRGKLATRTDGHLGSNQRATAVHRLHEERATRPPHRIRVWRRHRAFRRAGSPSYGYPHEGPGVVGRSVRARGTRIRAVRDVVNAGFIQGQESFVRVQVVYDERLPLDNYEGVDITGLNQEVRPKSPYELNVMRITVDGKPIDDPGRSSSDIQRCTDVALDTPRSTSASIIWSRGGGSASRRIR